MKKITFRTDFDMISIPSKNEEDGPTSFWNRQNPEIPELQLPRGKLQGSIGMTRMTPSMASCTSGEGNLGPKCRD